MKFELNNLARNCPNDEIVKEIQRVDSIINKNILTKNDYDLHAKNCSAAVVKRFGSWKKALEIAGLGLKYSGKTISDKMVEQKSKSLTDQEILNELVRIANALKQDYLMQSDVDNNSSLISHSTIIYRFGSWQKGLELAKIQTSPGFKRKLTIEDYYENLLNVWTHYGRQPIYSEMDMSPSLIKAGSYKKRFRGWRNALESFVNYVNDEDNKQQLTTLKDQNLNFKTHESIKTSPIKTEDKRDISVSLRYKVLSRDHFRCVRCGRSPANISGVELHIDHKIPFSKGGKTVLENLETKCKECNLGKSNKHIE